MCLICFLIIDQIVAIALNIIISIIILLPFNISLFAVFSFIPIIFVQQLLTLCPIVLIIYYLVPIFIKSHPSTVWVSNMPHLSIASSHRLVEYSTVQHVLVVCFKIILIINLTSLLFVKALVCSVILVLLIYRFVSRVK